MKGSGFTEEQVMAILREQRAGQKTVTFAGGTGLALTAGCALTVLLYVAMIWVGPRLGLRL